MPNGAYTPDLTPVARPGDYVRLDPDGDVYEVQSYLAQPGVTESITVAAGDREIGHEVKSIRMPENWLGQFRLLNLQDALIDGVEIEVDQDGKQAPLYTTKEERGTIDYATGDVSGGGVEDFAHSLTEQFVFEDNPPYYTIANTTDAEETVDLTFSGFQYRLSNQPVSPPANATPVALPVAQLQE